MRVRALVRAILTFVILTAPLPAVPWIGTNVVTAQDDGGGWTFDDEEEAQPTWADEFRNQGTDIVAVTALAGDAGRSLLRLSGARAPKYPSCRGMLRLNFSRRSAAVCATASCVAATAATTTIKALSAAMVPPRYPS